MIISYQHTHYKNCCKLLGAKGHQRVKTTKRAKLKNKYKPPSSLFLTFTELKFSEESILSFANEYGNIFSYAEEFLHFTEEWYLHIARLRYFSELFVNNDMKSVSSAYQLKKRIKEDFILDKITNTLRVRITRAHFRANRIIASENKNPELLDAAKQDKWPDVAKAYCMSLINDELFNQWDITYRPNSDDSGPEDPDTPEILNLEDPDSEESTPPKVIDIDNREVVTTELSPKGVVIHPYSLLTFMYACAAQMILREKEFRQCSNRKCHKWFEPNRNKQIYCCNNCRVVSNRSKKN